MKVAGFFALNVNFQQLNVNFRQLIMNFIELYRFFYYKSLILFNYL